MPTQLKAHLLFKKAVTDFKYAKLLARALKASYSMELAVLKAACYG